MIETNKIYQGDCLEVMKDIDDNSIDMILCDLPYGTTAIKWDIIIPFELLWDQYKRIIKDNGAIVLTASQPFASALLMSNIKMFKYELIWCKSKALGFTHTKNMPMKKHENILVFSKANIKHIGQENRMIYLPQDLKPLNKKVNGEKSCKADKEGHNFSRPSNKEYIQEFTNYPTTLLYFNNEGKTKHPTQKPVALFEYLIKTYTNEGDLVLDNCAGSGTTAVACRNTNRNYILIVKEEKYINIINKRLSQPIQLTFKEFNK